MFVTLCFLLLVYYGGVYVFHVCFDLCMFMVLGFVLMAVV